MSIIEAGDPYQAQIEATMRLVMERGGWRNRHRLCYQSRVGPGKWLRPSLEEELKSLASQGAKRILVIPIAFVSDHVETLSEIDIEARDLAGRLGITQFEVMPALNDSPRFIQALAELVLEAISCPQPIDTIGQLQIEIGNWK
jgi:ferrochelatase